jgi:hypothetical protein
MGAAERKSHWPVTHFTPAEAIRRRCQVERLVGNVVPVVARSMASISR